MIIITDLLKVPIDEGAKVTTYSILQELDNLQYDDIFSLNGNLTIGNNTKSYSTNKLFFNCSFLRDIKRHSDNRVLYIPESSITFFSFLRGAILSFTSGKDVTILSLQPRNHNFIIRQLIKAIIPHHVITQSYNTSSYLSGLGIKNTILPLGVDEKKYFQFDLLQKQTLKKEKLIGHKKLVLLHVGHIQKSRNLDWLVTIKKNNPKIEIFIVGSTYNKDDEELHTKLQEAGIRIIREYAPHMEEIYNIADYYIFPVLRNDGAIETPLSVIEAMACNLPVITTRFGSLPDTFNADEDFHYVESTEEIIKIVEKPRVHPCKNREKISPFTWKEIAEKLVDIVEQ